MMKNQLGCKLKISETNTSFDSTMVTIERFHFVMFVSGPPGSKFMRKLSFHSGKQTMNELGNLFVLLGKREFLFFYHNWQESSYNKIRCFNEEFKTKLSNGITNTFINSIKTIQFL